MEFNLTQIVREATQSTSLTDLVILFLVVGVIFGTIERIFPATRRPFWRPHFALDLFYWFFTPLFTKALTNLVLVISAVALFMLLGRDPVRDALHGFGPIAQQPLWLQTIEMLLLADLIGYWTHRWFHVSRFWRFHAVHHSPKYLDWLSAYRMHPLNEAISTTAKGVPLLLLGFSPLVIAAYVPFIVVYVVFLHTNIALRLGPLDYLIVTPTFHRWHHSSEPEALDKNYATMFPFWDLLFGTFYLPKRQPLRYGVKDNSVPDDFVGQMLYPFVGKPQTEAETVSALQR